MSLRRRLPRALIAASFALVAAPAALATQYTTRDTARPLNPPVFEEEYSQEEPLIEPRREEAGRLAEDDRGSRTCEDAAGVTLTISDKAFLDCERHARVMREMDRAESRGDWESPQFD